MKIPSSEPNGASLLRKENACVNHYQTTTNIGDGRNRLRLVHRNCNFRAFTNFAIDVNGSAHNFCRIVYEV